MLIWNPTVANLTLMALGSSAPEILLSLIGVVTAINEPSDPLGPSCIVGSASYNLLMISAVSIVAPIPRISRIKHIDVFIFTAIFSVCLALRISWPATWFHRILNYVVQQTWAYIWILIILEVTSPGVVEVWEALVTFIQFPLFVFLAYGQDVKWKIWGLGSTVAPDEVQAINDSVTPAPAQKHSYGEYRRKGLRMFAGGRCTGQGLEYKVSCHCPPWQPRVLD